MAETMTEVKIKPIVAASGEPVNAAHPTKGRYFFRLLITDLMLLGFASVFVLFALVFLVPHFRDIFADFRTPLPRVSEIVLNVSDFVANQYGWLVVLMMVPLTALGLAGLRRVSDWIGDPFWR